MRINEFMNSNDIYICYVHIYIYTFVCVCLFIYVYIHFPVIFERFIKQKIPDSGGSGIFALGDPWRNWDFGSINSHGFSLW